jgi:exopolysaccharide biosynthesis polyprenyl glycosylphosphotransferase
MSEILDTLERPAPISSFSWTTFRPKRQELVFRRLVLIADMVVLVASFAAAYALRQLFPPTPFYGTLLPFSGYTWLLWVVVPTWVYLARRLGLMHPENYRSLHGLVLRVVKLQTLAGLVLFSAMYLTRSVEVSRLLLQVFVGASFIMLVMQKLAVRFVLVQLGGPNRSHVRRVLVLGTTPVAARFSRLLQENAHWGAQVAGFLTAGEPTHRFAGKPVLGHVCDLAHVVRTTVIDEVTLAGPVLDAEKLQDLATICIDRGVSFRTLVAMPDNVNGRYHAEDLGNGMYMVSLERAPEEPTPLTVKRAIDLLGSVVGLVLCVIVFVVFARRIRRESGGSAVFSQVRIGRNGRPFTCLKFRTMVVDAEERLQELRASNEMQGAVFKMKDDPRVTPIGRFLRRTYLDELPQFWNVFRGDMSLVGTRPPIPEEVEQYSASHWSRLGMRPGITGLWQVAGNGTVRDFDDIVRLDRQYIDNWSLWLDFKLLLRTCQTVLRRAGH